MVGTFWENENLLLYLKHGQAMIIFYWQRGYCGLVVVGEDLILLITSCKCIVAC